MAWSTFRFVMNTFPIESFLSFLRRKAVRLQRTSKCFHINNYHKFTLIKQTVLSIIIKIYVLYKSFISAYTFYDSFHKFINFSFFLSFQFSIGLFDFSDRFLLRIKENVWGFEKMDKPAMRWIFNIDLLASSCNA